MVQSANRLRYAALAQVQSANRLRYSTQAVQTWLNRLRYAATRSVQSNNSTRYRCLSQAYDQIWRRGRANDPNSLPQVSIKVDGLEVCPAPYALQIVLAESAPTQWEVRIKDPSGYYHPKNASSPYFGKLRRGTRCVIRVTWEGAELQLEGYTTGFSHARSWETAGQFDLVWKGIDATSLPLFRSGVTLATLASGRNTGLWTTRDAARVLLTELGIPHNLALMATNNIRLQNRQNGRPGDWFQALLDVLWHKWIVRGNTLHVWRPNYFGVPQWHYGAGAARILNDNYSQDNPTPITSVTARRALVSNSNLPPIEHDAFGRFSQKFNPPIEGLYWKIISDVGGLFSDFYLKRGGATVAVRDNRGAVDAGLTTAVGGMIDECVYTWGNVAGSIATGGLGKIQFRGAEQDREDQLWGTDPTRSVTRVNHTAIAAGAEPNHKELSASTLIPDLATLEAHGDGYLIEEWANTEPQSFGVPLNLALWPGELVQIHDDRIGTEEVRYVRRHALTISPQLPLCGSRLDTVWIDPNLDVGAEDE